MIALVIVLTVLGGLIALGVALAVVRRAMKHGNTYSGLSALVEDLMTPRRAWTGFALVASSIILTTAAGILSLFV